MLFRSLFAAARALDLQHIRSLLQGVVPEFIPQAENVSTRAASSAVAEVATPTTLSLKKSSP